MVRYSTAFLVLLAFLLGPALTRGADERLPAKVRVAILFKALTYDHNLKSRCPNGLRIGVVSLSGNPESSTVANETAAEIKANAGKKVKGLRISVVPLPIQDLAGLKSGIAKENVNTLYLSPGLAGLVAPILGFAGQKKILVLTGEGDYVKAGAAIGAVLRNQKPKILVHLKAAGSQGAKLDARLLRLVEVVQ